MNEPLKSDVVTIIRKAFPDAIAVYRFGSSGTSFETPESDVDLAYLLPVGHTPKSMLSSQNWACSEKLSEILHKDVDLICFNEAPGVLQKMILTEGRRLYCSDTPYTDEMETDLISDCLAFSETRDILKQDFIDALKGINNDR